VGVLDEEPLPIIELQSHREFFDFEAKYRDGVAEHLFDLSVSPEAYRQVQDASVDAYRALGCRGFARVDLRLSDEAQPFILEVNTIPGFTPVSLFPEAARKAGMDFPELCHRLVDLALRDHSTVRERHLTNQRGG
jgi:D-alanine-D-alanine ligase